MNTDARRKASAAFVQKRKEAGYRKVTLWLSPEAVFRLDALKAAAGSKDKAADAAILAWAGPGAAKAEKPASAPKTKPAAEPRAKAPAVHVDVPVYVRPKFNPQQKKPKGKS